MKDILIKAKDGVGGAMTTFRQKPTLFFKMSDVPQLVRVLL
jgi:hypothetical protein